MAGAAGPDAGPAALALGMLALAARDARRRAPGWPRPRCWPASTTCPRCCGEPADPAGSWPPSWTATTTAARRAVGAGRARLRDADAASCRHRVDAVTHGLRRDQVCCGGCCWPPAAAATPRLSSAYQELQRGRLLARAVVRRPDRRRRCRRPRPAGIHELAAPSSSEPTRHGPLRTRCSPVATGCSSSATALLDQCLRDRSRTAGASPSRPYRIRRAATDRCKPGALYVAPVLRGDELYLLVCHPVVPSASWPPPARPGSSSARSTPSAAAWTGSSTPLPPGLAPGPGERRETRRPAARTSAAARWATRCGRCSTPGGRAAPRAVGARRRAARGTRARSAPRRPLPRRARTRSPCTFGGSLLSTSAGRPARARGCLRRGRDRIARGAAGRRPRGRGRGGVVLVASPVLHGAAGVSRDALRRQLPARASSTWPATPTSTPRTRCRRRIGLPSGERWRALDWLDEPLDGLPLVTLSACRSAEVGAAGRPRGVRPGDGPAGGRRPRRARRAVADRRPRGVAVHVAFLPSANCQRRAGRAGAAQPSAPRRRTARRSVLGGLAQFGDAPSAAGALWPATPGWCGWRQRRHARAVRRRRSSTSRPGE